MKAPTITVPAGQAKPKQPAAAWKRTLDLVLSKCELWHAHDNGPPQGYATFQKDGHSEHVELRTSAGRLWLGGLAHRELGLALSRAESDRVLDALEARAIHDGKRLDVQVRIADLGSTIYLDLADDAWRVVEIDAQGYRVIPGADAPVKFRRPNGTKPLPEPKAGGKLADLGKYIHTDAQGLSLVAAWLVGSFTSRGSAPVLCISGQQGSAKTTATGVAQSLIDPRGGSKRSAPKSDQDLAIAARNAWIVSLDNLSKMPGDLADSLCRLSTGAAFATRTLYTNGEECIFEARRPVILNSIVDIVSRPDLLDRAIVLPLLEITSTERIAEGEFWARFEEDRPLLLGALLGALSGALSRWEATNPAELPRLADWYRLALATGDALPGGIATFQAALAEMAREAVSHALEAAPIGLTLVGLLEKHGGWNDTTTALMSKLNEIRAMATARDDNWPKTTMLLVGALKRLAPVLQGVGWKVTFGNRDGSSHSHGRRLKITPTNGKPTLKTATMSQRRRKS